MHLLKISQQPPLLLPRLIADTHPSLLLDFGSTSSANWIKKLKQTLVHSSIRSTKEKMGTESVMVDEIPFPSEITKNKTLVLIGHGITDIEIHFLQIKFTAIGVYVDPAIAVELQTWKGKSGKELCEDDSFYDALISAKADIFLRIVVIKEIKGSQYGVQLESSVRDRLAAVDKYEEEEEEALEKLVEFFQGKYMKKNSIITFHFPSSSNSFAEVCFSTEEKEDAKIVMENANVVEMIKKWYLGGSRAVSSTTVASLAEGVATLISK